MHVGLCIPSLFSIQINFLHFVFSSVVDIITFFYLLYLSLLILLFRYIFLPIGFISVDSLLHNICTDTATQACIQYDTLQALYQRYIKAKCSIHSTHSLYITLLDLYTTYICRNAIAVSCWYESTQYFGKFHFVVQFNVG